MKRLFLPALFALLSTSAAAQPPADGAQVADLDTGWTAKNSISEVEDVLLASPAGALTPPLDLEAEAMRQYLATGTAPVLHRSQERVIPYGVETATLVCPLLGVCVVDLEPGEQVLEIALADPRWHVGPSRSGATEAPRYHLIVKPTAPALATNMFVTTDRRTYDIDLRSPSATEAADPDFKVDRRLAFYYPTDMIQRVRQEEAVAAAAEVRRAQALVAPLGSPDLSSLNFNYEIRRFQGNPVRVFDDGRKTYIELARRHGLNDAPALVAITEDGSPAILNYRLSPDGRYYIVDSLLHEARLLYRAGKKTRAATIKRIEG